MGEINDSEMIEVNGKKYKSVYSRTPEYFPSWVDITPTLHIIETKGPKAIRGIYDPATNRTDKLFPIVIIQKRIFDGHEYIVANQFPFMFKDQRELLRLFLENITWKHELEKESEKFIKLIQSIIDSYETRANKYMWDQRDDKIWR